MSKYTPEQREEILREAREHLAAAVNLKPRDGLLVDLHQRPCEPEPEPEPPSRFATRAFRDELMQAIVDECVGQLDAHRQFILDLLPEINRRAATA